MELNEKSESGSPIFRYDGLEPKPFQIATGDGGTIEEVSGFFEQNLGPIAGVFHEIVSDKVHLDIHWIKPSQAFPFNTLFTTGMSDQPMNCPAEQQDLCFAELLVLLPPSWKLEVASKSGMEEAFKDENNYWPLRWLKIIARLPHDYGSWIGPGHTIPNGENAEPLAPNTKLGCLLVMPSITLGEKFHEFKMTTGKVVKFYSLYPIYKEEMNLKLKSGLDALLDKFDEFKVSEVVDVNRKNCCGKKGLFGWW